MSDTSESIVLETTRRIMSDLADPQTVNAAKTDSYKAPLWQALEESGLSLAWVPEEFGGAGADVNDGFDVLRMAGQYVAPVSVAENLLAGWYLAASGQTAPTDAMTVAPVRDRDTITVSKDGVVTGTAHAVPFARDAKKIVVLGDAENGAMVAVVDPGKCTITDRPHDLGGGRADITFQNVQAEAVSALKDGVSRKDLWTFSAAARAMQMAGALESCLALGTQYSQEREAFGRPIAKFQAIQQSLAQLAGEVAAALTAAGSAADTLQNERDNAPAVFLEVAAAKIRVGEAARDGITIVHQVHGAIGFTSEYVLQRYTRNLMSWRDDFGEESQWAVELGALVAQNGDDQLWPMLTTR